MPISIARHERMVYGDIRLYSGTAHPELADEIAEYLEYYIVRTGCHHIPQ